MRAIDGLWVLALGLACAPATSPPAATNTAPSSIPPSSTSPTRDVATHEAPAPERHVERLPECSQLAATLNDRPELGGVTIAQEDHTGVSTECYLQFDGRPRITPDYPVVVSVVVMCSAEEQAATVRYLEGKGESVAVGRWASYNARRNELDALDDDSDCLLYITWPGGTGDLLIQIAGPLLDAL